MLDKCRLQLLKKKQTDIHFRVHDLFLFGMEIVLDLTQPKEIASFYGM